MSFKVSNETKVGILASFALAIMIIGYSFLKGNNIFNKDVTLYTKYEFTDGLTSSSSVMIKGFKIGRVSNMQLIDNEYILTEIKVNNEYQIPVNSVARVMSADIMGTKVIEVVLGDATDYAQDGDTIFGDIELSLTESVKREILPVKNKAEQLMGSFDSLITKLQVVVGDQKIESSLNNVESATESFAKLMATLDTVIKAESNTIKGILRNVEGITANINDNGDNIDTLLANLAVLSDSLKRADIPHMVTTLDSTLQALNAVVTKINSGDGTLGMLLNDPELYDNLTRSTSSLDSLLTDLKDNPSRYVHFSVFGRNPDKDKKKD